jgi:hypothetical protein
LGRIITVMKKQRIGRGKGSGKMAFIHLRKRRRT